MCVSIRQKGGVPVAWHVVIHDRVHALDVRHTTSNPTPKSQSMMTRQARTSEEERRKGQTLLSEVRRT